MGKAENEDLIKALMSEVEALRKSSESLLFAFDRVFGFAVALVVGGLGVGVTAGHKIVLAFIPCPLAIFYLHLLAMNVEGLSRAGHKWFLEEKLNSLIGISYLEEPYVAPTRKAGTRFGRPGVLLTQISVAIVLVAVTFVGLLPVLERAWYFVVIYALSVALPLVGLVASVMELSRAYQLGYDAAKSGYNAAKSGVADGSTTGGQLPQV